MSITLIIFGASGDLTSRKLVPALFTLFLKGRLPADTRIVGFARTQYTDEQWRESLRQALEKEEGDKFEATRWRQFAPCLTYMTGNLQEARDFAALHDKVRVAEDFKPVTRVYYLAIAPQFYESTVANLGTSGLADEEHGPRRI